MDIFKIDLILDVIFNSLCADDIKQCRLVSRQWNELAMEQLLTCSLVTLSVTSDLDLWGTLGFIGSFPRLRDEIRLKITGKSFTQTQALNLEKHPNEGLSAQLALLLSQVPLNKNKMQDSQSQWDLISQGFLPEGEENLIRTMKFHMRICGHEKNNWNMIFSSLEVKNPMYYQWTIDNKLGIFSLMEDFSKMLETEEGTDVTFVVSGGGIGGETGGDEFKISAHKAILMARSSVFRTMFCIGMTWDSTCRCQVLIQDISLKVMKLFLQFMYSGRLVGDWRSEATGLLHAAYKFKLILLELSVHDAIERAD